MDTLCILSLACRGSMMKRLIALLLLEPIVANAADYTCSYVCTLPDLTSGTLTLSDGEYAPTGSGNAQWTASGPGYETGGGSGSVQGMGSQSYIPYGSGAGTYLGDNSDGYLSMSLTINGMPWGLPNEPELGNAGAFLSADTDGLITHAGTYLASFDGQFQFFGQPAPPGWNPYGSCTLSDPCATWHFNGGGTGVLYVSDYPGEPGYYEITGGTFAFSTPEPSTASLLLIGFGFAGLTVLARRRRPRATLLA
jgi:PEP-CTERM motif